MSNTITTNTTAAELANIINATDYGKLYRIGCQVSKAEYASGEEIEIRVIHDCDARAIGLNEGSLADWIDSRKIGKQLAAAGYTWYNSDENSSIAYYHREAATISDIRRRSGLKGAAARRASAVAKTSVKIADADIAALDAWSNRQPRPAAIHALLIKAGVIK